MPVRSCAPCNAAYYVTDMENGDPCPYCGQIPIGDHMIGPMHGPIVPRNHIIRITNGSAYLDRVTWGNWIDFNYFSAGWRIDSMAPREDGPIVLIRGIRGQRMISTVQQFENRHERNGWVEFIPREMPAFNEDDPPVCDWCSHDCADDNNHIAGTNELICNSCWDEFIPCRVCALSFNEDDMRELTNGRGFICEIEPGYSECGDCGNYDRDYNLFTMDNGSSVCRNCSNDYHSCDNCSNLLSDGYGDMCDSCRDQYEDDYSESEESPYVRNYSHKPNPNFHGSDSSILPYLGIEIEIGTPGVLAECAEIAHTALGGLGYLKEDCSITDHYSSGFEIVTHPMTHEYARNSFPWHMLDALRNEGADANDTGIHVHVSRDGFSDTDHIYRWLRLLMSNKEQCIKIARRDSTQWAFFREFNAGDARRMANGYSFRRYEAINNENSSTIELRMFRGSLDRTEIQSAFDLTHASVEYTRDNECPDWHSFTAWLDNQGDTYNALIAQNGK